MAFPAGLPAWALPSVLPCGVPTFLGAYRYATRSPGRLLATSLRRAANASSGTLNVVIAEDAM